ncbi:hypothetical protein, partial [Methylobacterium variabile]|uniref:hypothetical protein n=1 Tax=Methylobacterium variabile TaxID=298794 RepID=UPI001ADF5AF3
LGDRTLHRSTGRDARPGNTTRSGAANSQCAPSSVRASLAGWPARMNQVDRRHAAEMSGGPDFVPRGTAMVSNS